MLKKFKITVDGKSHTVTVEDMVEESELVASSSLSPVVAAVVPPTPAAPTASATPSLKPAGAGDIPSPIGGVVKEVKVVVGQQVNEGDLVVVLEAMKMKTNIFSNVTGKVSAVNVKLGDAVDFGQILIVIG